MGAVGKRKQGSRDAGKEQTRRKVAGTRRACPIPARSEEHQHPIVIGPRPNIELNSGITLISLCHLHTRDHRGVSRVRIINAGLRYRRPAAIYTHHTEARRETCTELYVKRAS